MLKKARTVPDYKCKRRAEPQHRSHSDENAPNGEDPHRRRVTQVSSGTVADRLRPLGPTCVSKGGECREKARTKPSGCPNVLTQFRDWRWPRRHPPFPYRRTNSGGHSVAEHSHEPMEIHRPRRRPYLSPKIERAKSVIHCDEPGPPNSHQRGGTHKHVKTTEQTNVTVDFAPASLQKAGQDNRTAIL